MLDRLITRGLIPTFILRVAIRCLLLNRLRKENHGGVEEQARRLDKLIQELKNSPIALEVAKANEQHYEVPESFYKLTLGANLKYSSALYAAGISSLTEAEGAMLSLYCQRAEIKDGMKILELGCGWGSLTLWLAKEYPNSRIVGISNSNSQREFIMKQAATRNLSNLEIITNDINNFHTEEKFDRIVSIEMFEHMRNYQKLLHRISTWLSDNGKLFVHIFAHKHLTYLFETKGAANWMGKYFFTAGIMPGDNLLLYFQDHMKIQKHWIVNGQNYSKTAAAWLYNLERNKQSSLEILSDIYGKDQAEIWYSRWKLFFLACEELFGFRKGEEWIVSHYLFTKQTFA